MNGKEIPARMETSKLENFNIIPNSILIVISASDKIDSILLTDKT